MPSRGHTRKRSKRSPKRTPEKSGTRTESPPRYYRERQKPQRDHRRHSGHPRNERKGQRDHREHRKDQREAHQPLDQIGHILQQILTMSEFRDVWFFIVTTEGFFNGTLKKLLPDSKRPSVLQIETLQHECVHINLEKLIALNIVDKDITFIDRTGHLVFSLLSEPHHHSKKPSDILEMSLRTVLQGYVNTQEKVKIYLIPSSAPQSKLDAVGYGVAFLNKNSFVVTSYISAISPYHETEEKGKKKE